MADLLGSHLVFFAVPVQRLSRHIILCAGRLHNIIFGEGIGCSIQLATIIILYIFDPECKTTIKNIIPNLKSIISPSNDKIDIQDE